MVSKTWSIFALLVLLASACTTVLRADDRPNVVVILADDMGFGDVQALNNASRIPTPNLDQLATSGMVFVDAHTPSGVCTPTRYGLLTGRYCWRSRLKRGVLNGYGPPLIDRDRPTIASILAEAGYGTYIVGKWHLGLGFVKPDGKTIDYSAKVTHGPNDLGFQQSFVIPASLDFPPYIYLENGTPTKLPEIEQPAVKFPGFLRKGPRASDFVMEECLDRLAKQAVSYIQAAAKQDQPFFLYFPLTAPHKPVLPHSRFRGATDLGPYGDFVHQVDATVGQVMKALEQTGSAENTMVLYTSDNGSFMYRLDDQSADDHVIDSTIQKYRADHHTANYKFRGTKADIWEGGHHVPFFVRWPKKIRASTVCGDVVCLTDVLATVAEVGGAKIPDGAAQDSFSFASAFASGKRQTDRPAVIHHSASGMFAVREGPWKLVLGNGSGGREAPRGKAFQRPYQLFNLSQDIGEKQELRTQHPEIAKRLEQTAMQIIGDDLK